MSHWTTNQSYYLVKYLHLSRSYLRLSRDNLARMIGNRIDSGLGLDVCDGCGFCVAKHIKLTFMNHVGCGCMA